MVADLNTTNRLPPATWALNVLIIDDSEGDAELVVDALKQGGFELRWRRVQSAGEMRRALAASDWDLIVADHSLPSFSDTEAFAIYQEGGRDVPFIIVSGTICEDAAVAAMKAGVHDYLNKGRLSRLAPAVRRELTEAENRRLRSRAESQLQVAQSELRRQRDELVLHFNLINLSHDAIITSTVEGVVTAWNTGATEVYGWTEAEAVGRLSRLAATRALIHASERNVRSHQQDRCDGEQIHATRDGRKIIVDSRQVLLRAENGAAGLILEINRDITARKLAEEDLKHSLSKNIALLQEVHHRVKNNLQIVCSLLFMQGQEVQDQRVAAMLEVSERRIASMAMIHEHLYHQADMSSVDLAEYVRNLAAQLFSAYSTNESVTYRLELASTRLTVEQAIPCGLILNELISNALKHAYPDGGGEVLIGLSSDGNRVVLKVSDRGVGVPAGTDWAAFKSLGIQMVYILTKQLNGHLEIGTAPGTSFTIHFLTTPETAPWRPTGVPGVVAEHDYVRAGGFVGVDGTDVSHARCDLDGDNPTRSSAVID